MPLGTVFWTWRILFSGDLWLYSEDVYADIMVYFLVSIGPHLFQMNNISVD